MRPHGFDGVMSPHGALLRSTPGRQRRDQALVVRYASLVGTRAEQLQAKCRMHKHINREISLKQITFVPRVAVTFLLSILLLLSACGGGEDTAAQPTETAVRPTPAVETTPAETEPELYPTDEAAQDEDATPTRRAGAATTASPRATSDTTATGGEQENNAGFSFTTPDGWQTVSNDALPGIGGIALLVPAGTDTNNPEESIILNVGQSLFFITNTLEPDTTSDELLDILSQSAESSNASVSEREDADIGGKEGRVANINDPETEGRVAVTKVDDDRWFLMLGVAKVGEWNPDAFNSVLASVDFFEPTMEDFTPELPDLNTPMVPNATDESDTGNQQDLSGGDSTVVGPGTPEQGDGGFEPGSSSESDVLPSPGASGGDDTVVEPDTPGGSGEGSEPGSSGGSDDNDVVVEPGTPSGDDSVTSPETPDDGIFPLPPDTTGIVNLSDQEEVNFQTSLTLDEVMQFYRDTFTEDGATERTITTVTTDDTFNLVFDDWPQANGKAVVVQGVKLAPDNINVNIRLEDV